MHTLKAIELKHIDSLDIDEAIFKAEKVFNVRFNADEFNHVTNLDELCEVIVSKIETSAENINDCTSQQAFYKLRSSISLTFNINQSQLQLSTKLRDIFPKRGRRKNIRQLEEVMGFKLDLLAPPKWVSASTAFFLLFSFIFIFIKWEIGIPAFALSIIVLKLTNKYSKHFTVKTIGEAAQKLTKENYRNSRRNPDTINKMEVRKQVKDLIIYELGF